jgi:cell division ATPase FtsA
MKLPFLQNINHSAERFLSISINANDVKCIAFYASDAGSYKIIGAGKTELDPGSVHSGVVIERDSVVEAVRQAVSKATENAEGAINKIIFGVNGDLCIGIMTTARSKKPEKQVILKKDVDELYKKISEGAFIQAQNEYLETTGDADTELEMITSTDVYLKADNQPVGSLDNVEAAVVEAAVFNAFAPKFYLSALQRIAKSAGLEILAIGSEMYTLAQYIKKTHPEEKDFVLIDIDGDATNAAVVFSGGIVDTKSLNIGYLQFIEGISDKMGITFREAEKMLQSYMADKLSQAESGVVQTCLKEVIDIWASGLETLFAEFSGVKTFASKIYVTGIAADISEVFSALQNEPWTKSIPFQMPPTFEKVNLGALSGVTDATGIVSSSAWLPTTSTAIIHAEIFKGATAL